MVISQSRIAIHQHISKSNFLSALKTYGICEQFSPIDTTYAFFYANQVFAHTTWKCSAKPNNLNHLSYTSIGICLHKYLYSNSNTVSLILITDRTNVRYYSIRLPAELDSHTCSYPLDLLCCIRICWEPMRLRL